MHLKFNSNYLEKETSLSLSLSHSLSLSLSLSLSILDKHMPVHSFAILLNPSIYSSFLKMHY
jgi:hypothetical protein